MSIPNEESFKSWLADPLTQFVLRDFLGKAIQEVKDGWATGSYTRESDSGTLQANAAAIAHVKTLQQLSDLEYADIITMMQDEPRSITNEPASEL